MNSVCLNTELPADDREKWEAFISGQLADTNKRNTIDLVSNYVIMNTDVKLLFHDTLGVQCSYLDSKMFFYCDGFVVQQIGFVHSVSAGGVA